MLIAIPRLLLALSFLLLPGNFLTAWAVDSETIQLWIDRAVEFLSQIGESESEVSAFSQVARKFTEAGELDQLEKLYDSLDSPVARAHLAIEAANRMLWLAEAPEVP